jgi:hypothetical protein
MYLNRIYFIISLFMSTHVTFTNLVQLLIYLDALNAGPLLT